MTATTKLKCSCSTLRDACAAVHTRAIPPPFTTDIRKLAGQTLPGVVYKPWLQCYDVPAPLLHLQHSCLFDPPNFYFDTHFDELSGKLFKPFFHSIIGILLNRCGLKSHPHRIQGTVGTILHELKDEPFIVAKLEEIRLKLLDKPCKEIVYDVVDLWQGLSIVNGERPSQLQHGCSL